MNLIVFLFEEIRFSLEFDLIDAYEDKINKIPISTGLKRMTIYC